jgi:multidrug efflux pump subunit AcrA (membrane-fusion protein)
MAVELDVENKDQRLSPGMFAEVNWPVRRRQASLFVPRTAIVKTTERTFVVRVNQGKIEWVDVKPGMTADNLVEVFGDLHSGDLVAVRGTDELRSGTKVSVTVQH